MSYLRTDGVVWVCCDTQRNEVVRSKCGPKDNVTSIHFDWTIWLLTHSYPLHESAKNHIELKPHKFEMYLCTYVQ